MSEMEETLKAIKSAEEKLAKAKRQAEIVDYWLDQISYAHCRQMDAFLLNLAAMIDPRSLK